jgi:hypothetical protein
VYVFPPNFWRGTAIVPCQTPRLAVSTRVTTIRDPGLEARRQADDAAARLVNGGDGPEAPADRRGRLGAFPAEKKRWCRGRQRVAAHALPVEDVDVDLADPLGRAARHAEP